jgi:predicted nucleotidyltransferase
MSAADLVDRVADELRAEPTLRLAVVFGSTARGTQRAESDVDVGIVPVDSELPLRAELALQVRLERVCQRPVHVVRLDRASTLLKWKVANEGRPVVSTPAHAWPRFVATSAIEFAELAPQLRDAEERFRARVANGTPP